MQKIIHGITGVFALLIVSGFFTITVITELFYDKREIIFAKQTIVDGLYLLVPVMIAAGISGKLSAGKRKGKIIKIKQRRMIIAAINGIFVLAPSAVILDNLSLSGLFNYQFYIIQGIELLAGSVNIILLGMNTRDGLLLSGHLRKRKKSLQPGSC